jgi:hypothetical protein
MSLISTGSISLDSTFNCLIVKQRYYIIYVRQCTIRIIEGGPLSYEKSMFMEKNISTVGHWGVLNLMYRLMRGCEN